MAVKERQWIQPILVSVVLVDVVAIAMEHLEVAVAMEDLVVAVLVLLIMAVGIRVAEMDGARAAVAVGEFPNGSNEQWMHFV